MANIIEQITSKAGLDPRLGGKTKPLNWYQTQVRNLGGAGKVNTNTLLKQGKLVSRIIPGYMYLYRYDPKDKDVPYYDMFPLVIPFRRADNGFFGINFHYLPYMMRLNILKEFNRFANSKELTEKTRIRLSYRVMESTRMFRFIQPAIRRYLNQQIRSRFLLIPYPDWVVASQLPVQRFKGAQLETVLRDTKKKSLKR
tara:strand:+ start:605 stop:1198 length:594 start_codon:yes stop_codon:yes gene_type:complete